VVAATSAGTGAPGPGATAASGTAWPWSHPAAPAAIAASDARNQKARLVAALLDSGAWAWACQAAALLRAELATGTPADLSAPLPLEAHHLATAAGAGAAPAPVPAALASLLDPASSDTPLSQQPQQPPSSPYPPFDVCLFPSVALGACNFLRGCLSTVALTVGPRAAVASALAGEKDAPLTTAAAAAAAAPPFPGPLADPLAPVVDPLPAAAAAAAPVLLAPLLRFAGPHISNDPALVVTLLRCVAASTHAVAAAAEAGRPCGPGTSVFDAQAAGLAALRSGGLLHAVSLCGSSVGVAGELWEAIRVLPWPER
jgi:hypothetical protein